MSEGVELSGVSIDYGNFRAVDNVSIHIKPGEFFSFLGPSGCGKTTILRMVSGFIDPTIGDVRIGGRSVKGIGPNKRPTALIFQNLALFPLMSVWENISFGLRVRGVNKADRRRRAEELLRIVDLPNVGDKMVGQLSGGQKQRIAIARALAVEPKVMLLDEPLSALDLKLRQHMRAELRTIQERTGVTFIYITHDQSEALAMSDRVGVMSRGRLQQVDTPERIYNNPANGFVASFVGETTVLDGVPDGLDGDLLKFRTPDGWLTARPGSGAASSKAARLFVRPERIKVGQATAPNVVEAIVTKVVFEGSLISVVGITPSGAHITAQFSNGSDGHVPDVGTRTSFSFDPHHAQVLLDDHAQVQVA